MMMNNSNINSLSTSPMTHHHNHHFERSRSRLRPWRRSRIGTAAVAVAALLLSTTAWLSLVFSGTTTDCWHRFKNWEASPHSSLRWAWNNQSFVSSPPPPPPPTQSRNRSLSETEKQYEEEEELSLKHIVFGIAGSSQLWTRRKEFVKLWWRQAEMRGHVWLEEEAEEAAAADNGSLVLLPPVMVSEDISRFRYTNPTGHPSGLRIARIITECFRLGLPNARWYVLGDDDTIFNVDNLVALLHKYDPSQMVYIGSPSESHSANTYFSHSMAFGGGGIAISHPLAQALSSILDDCLDRYPKLYGSDDRLHACISELGVPLTREPGFHQWDIRGSAHGILSSHPVAPFVSIHHVEAVDPIYPGLSSLDSLKLFTKAMRLDPASFLQRSICYDRPRRLTFSVSLGYVVRVFPNIVLPRELERSEVTYTAWNKIRQRNEFDFDTRDPYSSLCKRPTLFFLKHVSKQGNATLGLYARATPRDDFKRRVLCFPRSPPLRGLKYIQVMGNPPTKNWHLAPRRLCCKLNQTTEGLILTVGQCEKAAFSSITDFL